MKISVRDVVKVLGTSLLMVSCLLVVALSIGAATKQYQIAPVLSGSMEPFMPVGSLIVASSESPASLAPGQVITFLDPEQNTLVTHRVVEIETLSPAPVIRTKGDANVAVDPWVARLQDGPVWRTRVVVPYLGYFFIGLRHPMAQMIGTRVLPALLAIAWIVSIWRRKPAQTADEPGRHGDALVT